MMHRAEKDALTKHWSSPMHAFHGSPLILEESCETFVAILQASNGLTKKEACAMQLKDIPQLQSPFLPSRYDLY